ncbi:MAG: conjugal transfer protein TraL [Neisseriaceae bacterium]|nr:conjugal transfer protein TraL [Neisseriaceae bacterium]
MEQIHIPEFVDSPPQFLVWEMDDLAPILLGTLAGAIARYVTQNGWLFLVGVLLGFVLSYFYIKYKRNRLPGTLLHMLYCYTGVVPLNKRFSNGLLQRTNE